MSESHIENHEEANEANASSAPADAEPKQRRRLVLKPRSKAAGNVGGYAKKDGAKSSSNPFGAAKPREVVLAKKGVDWKKRDAELDKRLAKLPSMSKKQEEEYTALEQKIAQAKTDIEKAESSEAKKKAETDHEAFVKEKEAFIAKLMSERRARREPRRPSHDHEDRYSRGGHNEKGGDFSSFGGGRRHSGGRNMNRDGRSSFDERESGNKVFVGSLSWSVDDLALGEAFQKEGFNVVAANVVMDRDDRTRSRGFGYVTFADPSEVRKAIETMEGFEIFGRPIRVDMATSRGKRGGGGRTYNQSYSRGHSGRSGGHNDDDGFYDKGFDRGGGHFDSGKFVSTNYGRRDEY